MNPGELKTPLSFQSVSTSVVSGDISETDSTPVVIRCKLTQLQGYKKMQYTELLTKDVYEAECFDNAVLVKNATCTYGSDTLVVYDRIKNIGKSGTNEVKIVLYKK